MRRSDLKGGTEVMKGKVHCLFVYGTLLSGFENHQQLRDALFLGQARTKERYALYANWIPYVTRSRKVSRIRGDPSRTTGTAYLMIGILLPSAARRMRSE